MHLHEILTPSFRSIGEQLGLDISIDNGKLNISDPGHRFDPLPFWQQRLSNASSFCRACVAKGYLTRAQMDQAAHRYRLGRSKDDAVIYWQIDCEERIHDGKLMWYGPDCHRLKNRRATWVSFLLKRHYQFPDDVPASHCLFGLHLVDNSRSVAVVEAEKTAVILSAYYPQHVWLAAGGLGEVQADKFRPLRGQRIILFPDTDPTGQAYKHWYDAAQEVMRQPFWEGSPPIRVSPILELNATPDQKARKIDLVDYLFESRTLTLPNASDSAVKP